MTQHYIEWIYPGVLVSETSEQRIKSRSEVPTAPKHAFGYRFLDRTIVRRDGEELTGPRRNESAWFYLGGTVKTRAQMLRDMPGSILASNMKNNNIPRVVMTKFGQAIPLEPKDKVLP